MTEGITEEGAALLLAEKYRQALRFVPDIGWITWSGKSWEPDPWRAETLVAELAGVYRERALSVNGDDPKMSKKLQQAYTSLARRLESAAGQSAVLRCAQKRLLTPVEKVGGADNILPFANGVVELETGKLRKARPQDLVMGYCPSEYDPKAEAPRWKQFLDEVFSSSQVRVFVQKAAGLSVSGSIAEQKAIMCYGSGENGKSTFLTALLSALGPFALQAPRDLLTSEAKFRHPAEIADLRGIRMLVVQEPEVGSTFRTALFKELTGEEVIRARQMYGRWFSFRNQATIWISTNHRPSTKDQTHAFWRRIAILPFSGTVDPEKRDLRLLDKLKAEAAGILRWAVEGYRMWMEDGGLGMPVEIAEAVEAYKKESDSVSEFIRICCRQHPQFSAAGGELFRAYETYCSQRGLAAMVYFEFFRSLVDRGITKKRVTSGVRYEGIGLKPESERHEEEA